jgi:hypothetical protein
MALLVVVVLVAERMLLNTPFTEEAIIIILLLLATLHNNILVRTYIFMEMRLLYTTSTTRTGIIVLYNSLSPYQLLLYSLSFLYSITKQTLQPFIQKPLYRTRDPLWKLIASVIQMSLQQF